MAGIPRPMRQSNPSIRASRGNIVVAARKQSIQAAKVDAVGSPVRKKLQAPGSLSSSMPSLASSNSVTVARRGKACCDWLNSALQRVNSEHHVTDLAMDFQDGVLLSKIIRDIAGFDVTGIRERPSIEADRLENVEKCLQAVKESGIAVPETAAKEIIQGKAERLIEVFTAMSKVSSEHQRRVMTGPSGPSPAGSKVPGPAGLKPRIAAPPSGIRSPQTVSKLPQRAAVATPAAVTTETSAAANHTDPRSTGTGIQAPKTQTKLTIPSRKVRSFSQSGRATHPSNGGADADVSASAESSPEKQSDSSPAVAAVAAARSKAPVAIPPRSASNAVFSSASIITAAVAANSKAESRSVAATTAAASTASPPQLRKPTPTTSKLQPANASGLQTPGAIPMLRKMSPKPSPKSSPQHQLVIRSYSEEPVSPGRQRKLNGESSAMPSNPEQESAESPVAPVAAGSKLRAPSGGLRKPASRHQAGGGGEKVHRTMSANAMGTTSPSSSDERPLVGRHGDATATSPKSSRPVHRASVPILACTNNNNAILRMPTSAQTSDSDSSPSHRRTFDIRQLPNPKAVNRTVATAPADSRTTATKTRSMSDGLTATECPEVAVVPERPHNAADGKSNSSSDSEVKQIENASTENGPHTASSVLGVHMAAHHMQTTTVHFSDEGLASVSPVTMAAPSSGTNPEQPFSPMNIALLSMSTCSSPRHSPQSSSLSDSGPTASPPHTNDSFLSGSGNSSSGASTELAVATSGGMKAVMQSASPLASLPEVSPLGSRDNPVRTSWRRSSNAPRGGSKPSIAATTGFPRQPLAVTSTMTASPTAQHRTCASPSNQDVFTTATPDGAPPGGDWEANTGPLQRGKSFSSRSEARRSNFPRRMSSDNILDSTPMRIRREGSSSDESPTATVTNGNSRAAVSFRPRARTVPAQHFGDLKSGSHRDSGVSMTGHFGVANASAGGDSPTTQNDVTAKRSDAKHRHTSDSSTSTSSSPLLERYTLSQMNAAPVSMDSANLAISSPAAAMLMSPQRSLHGSKKSLAEQKVLEARLSELEDRNSQLQNEVVNTTRAMSQLQEIIEKKDSEVTTVLHAFKTKEEELEHIYTLLRTVAPGDWAQPQSAPAVDEVPACRTGSPLVPGNVATTTAAAAAAAAAAGGGYKSVTWDESSMTVAMALEKTKEKKKKKSWKTPFKLESFRKTKSRRTSSGSTIGGDESETNNDDIVDESPAHESNAMSAVAQQELQRVRAELQFAKAELSRMQITSLISKSESPKPGDLPHSQESITSQLASSGGDSLAYLDMASPTKSDRSISPLACCLYISAEGNKTYAGQMSITMATTWPQLDKVVSKALLNHAKAIDPAGGLGLTRRSVKQYTIAGIVREPHSRRASEHEDDLLPDALLNAEQRAEVDVTLRGAPEHECDELAYSSVIPKTLLSSYIGLVEDQTVIITGPTACGKSFLGRQLLKHILARHGVDSTAAILTTSPPRNITTPPQLEQHVKKVMEHFCKRFTTEESSSPIGLLIEDLDDTSCLDRHALASIRRDGERRVYVIITASRWPLCSNVNTVATRSSSNADQTNQGLNDNGSSAYGALNTSQCASIRLVTHHEPVKGLLTRFLNKRRIATQGRLTGNQTASICEWMPTAWEHINTFLHSIVSPHAVLGPCQYLTCPDDSQETARWFSSLWNFHILPYIIEAATWPLAPPLVQQDWYSPVTWLTESSPWSQLARRNSGVYLTTSSINSLASDIFHDRGLTLETLRQEDMVWHTPRAISSTGGHSLSDLQLPHDLLHVEKKNGLIPGTSQEDRLMRLLERVVMTSTPPPNSR